MISTIFCKNQISYHHIKLHLLANLCPLIFGIKDLDILQIPVLSCSTNILMMLLSLLHFIVISVQLQNRENYLFILVNLLLIHLLILFMLSQPSTYGAFLLLIPLMDIVFFLPLDDFSSCTWVYMMQSKISH